MKDFVLLVFFRLKNATLIKEAFHQIKLSNYSENI